MHFDEEGRNYAAVECDILSKTDPPDDGYHYCNVTWDTWGCFNYTRNGSTASISCPWYIKGFDKRLTATRACDDTGQWMVYPQNNNRTWSNYTGCVNQGHVQWHKQVIYTYVTGYAMSILALLLSLGIFFTFKQLQCDRINLHKNLFISYILNGAAWIPYYLEASMKPEVISSNPAWCQVLHVITQYFVTCNFFWMFCEGMYLHTIIVVAFMSGKKLLISCYIIGWGVPFVITTAYTVLRSMDPLQSTSCWLEDSNLVWIIFGPIIATLLANVVFLCNIVRVLVTKMRAINSPDTNQTRKAVRATVILIPLLGLQFILFPFTPETGTILSHVYSLASAFVTSFQGCFVALIFCFLNGEVISVIKRKWGQHRMMQSSHAMSTYYRHTTISMAEHSTYVASPHQIPNGNALLDDD